MYLSRDLKITPSKRVFVLSGMVESVELYEGESILSVQENKNFLPYVVIEARCCPRCFARIKGQKTCPNCGVPFTEPEVGAPFDEPLPTGIEEENK